MHRGDSPSSSSSSSSSKNKYTCGLPSCGCRKSFHQASNIYDHLLPKVARDFPDHPCVQMWSAWHPVRLPTDDSKKRLMKTFSKIRVETDPCLGDMKEGLRALMDSYIFPHPPSRHSTAKATGTANHGTARAVRQPSGGSSDSLSVASNSRHSSPSTDSELEYEYTSTPQQSAQKQWSGTAVRGVAGAGAGTAVVVGDGEDDYHYRDDNDNDDDDDDGDDDEEEEDNEYDSYYDGTEYRADPGDKKSRQGEVPRIQISVTAAEPIHHMQRFTPQGNQTYLNPCHSSSAPSTDRKALLPFLPTPTLTGFSASRSSSSSSSFSSCVSPSASPSLSSMGPFTRSNSGPGSGVFESDLLAFSDQDMTLLMTTNGLSSSSSSSSSLASLSAAGPMSELLSSWSSNVAGGPVASHSLPLSLSSSSSSSSLSLSLSSTGVWQPASMGRKRSYDESEFLSSFSSSSYTSSSALSSCSDISSPSSPSSRSSPSPFSQQGDDGDNDDHNSDELGWELTSKGTPTNYFASEVLSEERPSKRARSASPLSVFFPVSQPTTTGTIGGGGGGGGAFASGYSNGFAGVAPPPAPSSPSAPSPAAVPASVSAMTASVRVLHDVCWSALLQRCGRDECVAAALVQAADPHVSPQLVQSFYGAAADGKLVTFLQVLSRSHLLSLISHHRNLLDGFSK